MGKNRRDPSNASGCDPGGRRIALGLQAEHDPGRGIQGGGMDAALIIQSLQKYAASDRPWANGSVE